MFGAFLRAYRRRYNDPNRGFRGDYYNHDQLVRVAVSRQVWVSRHTEFGD